MTTDEEATLLLLLAVAVACILAATGCTSADLVAPPEPEPAECEECRAGCGVVG